MTLYEGKMIDKYVCPQCQVIVLPIQSKFIHPHLGDSSCLVCPECQTMVYLKEEK
mgnify:CR=1 FL=1